MDFESKYEISSTVDFIRRRNFTRVALQFPDELLKDSPRVAMVLRSELGKDVRLYVMADAAYGSCCVDEIGASHVNAECVVHYGHACMSPTSTLPAMFVFGKASIDVKDCVQSLIQCLSSSNKSIMVMFGLECAHALEDLKAKVSESLILGQSHPSLKVVYAEVAGLVIDPYVDSTKEIDQVTSHSNSMSDAGFNVNEDERKIFQFSNRNKTESGTSYCLGGLTWNVPDRKIEDYLLFWIGPDNAAFNNVMLTFNNCEIIRYDTDKRCLLKDLPNQQRILRRRYYLVEKAKDANIVGILVGTLGVAGYLHIIEQMKELIKRAGKKSYTLVMGRPNPAKLANFPECDVFVYVSCAQTALLDCKEFLAPVITPFEAVLAFSRGRQWTGEYVVNFQDLIASNIVEEVECAEEARFSFIKGGYMEDSHPQENGKEHDGSSLALTTITEKALSLQHQNPDSILFKGNARSGSEFFAARSYQGLNMQYENPAPPSYVMGRTGRAAAYVDEKRQAEGSPGVVD
ncbi:2-(3-amino-3-carboxypropyl)histidine synthase subunit 2-like [Zingiber officinale]|uniref:2-(3-amino-3-carboxypropyl)histidine synthase subunit 2-like n=1 Tax=Zingiber officinale TaxID=94328 RepID=UPI001C4C4412|nr:2-(3-amino-3-carboxypropyl)histidine synthase subunit 2-like [Zingiber officinale]